MKKNIFMVTAYLAAMLSFTGCQGDSSSQKPDMPKIDFNKSPETESTSLTSDTSENYIQPSSESKPEIIDIPETEPYAFNYKYDVSRGGMVITDYYRESPKVNIPSKLEGELVVYVDFSEVEKDITILVLPYGVKGFSLSQNIQESLSYIYIPTSVKTLYDYDFSKCTRRLTNVIYGDKAYDYKNVAYLIDSLKFDETGLSIASNHLLDVARYLTEVTVPEGINFIDKYAFDGCSVLTEVNLPNSIAMIDEFAFRGCSGLKEITIPKDTMYIGESAFGNCTNLTYVYLPDGLEFISPLAFGGSENVKVFFKDSVYEYNDIDQLYKVITNR